MTSATFPRTRRHTRIAATAAGLAAALALTTGCSGDGDGGGGGGGGGGDKDPSSAASAEPTQSADAGTGTDTGELDGNWLTTKGGKAVALVITGKEAGLFSTSGSICSGTAGKTSDMRMITLKCTDGNKDRAEGMVDSVDATTLKVTWEGFGAETYTRSEGEGLPPGLPTASLGS
ncbi:hypothetical protein C6Y14_20550 [Streptomyces dioscori]|uniref:Serine/threonine protein kinase n=1 Tax=Streptomyces dioscori TaxID=2109333 RepID=A0A2P8Q5Y8_9ACTN|nr:hypothetical protein [Streptomyces dioscori]PSM41660.1 hypothetical protein C6Y14_20550 [Streptomyces dioscori]